MHGCRHELTQKILKPRIILLANMALAALRVKNCAACVTACDQALKLGGALLIEGMENKLLFRRAKARCINTRSHKGRHLARQRQQYRELAMDDCRQILTAKGITSEYKSKTLELISKYRLGKPPVLVQACASPTCDETATREERNTPTLTKARKVLTSLERELLRDDVKNQLMEARVKCDFNKDKFLKCMPKTLFQARLRVATEYGFFTPGVAEHTVSGIDTVTESGGDTNAKKQQQDGHEAQQRSIDEMLTFVQSLCGRHESLRLQHNKLCQEIVGTITKTSS